MEKLIELLNKFERETFPEEHEYVRFPDGTDDDGGYWYYKEQPNMGENKGFNYSSRSDKRNCEINQLLIISKEFGFIQRLVENDKIDYRKVIEKEIEVGFKLERIKDYPNKIKEEDVEEVLMLLSIQDEPISFLLSILK